MEVSTLETVGDLKWVHNGGFGTI